MKLQHMTELLAVLRCHPGFSGSDEIIIDAGLQGLDILVQSSIAFPGVLSSKVKQELP